MNLVASDTGGRVTRDGADTTVAPETTVEPSQRRELCECPLTVRTHNPYTDDPLKLDERFVTNGTPRETIKAAQKGLRAYRRKKADTKIVFENGTEPVSHRYNDVYAKRKYAEAMNAAALLDDEFDELYSVMIVLTAYTGNARGEGRATVDHLHDLLASNQAVGRKIEKNIGERLGLDYARLAVIQPHEDVPGYAHIAWGLWVDGRVEIEDVYPAVEEHLEKCPVAREKDHPVAFEGSDVGKAIRRFKSTPQNNVAQGLVTELTKDLVGWKDNIESDDPGTRRRYERLGATLMASNTTQYRPDRCVDGGDNYGKLSWAVKQNRESWKSDGGEYLGEFEGHQFEEDGPVYDPRNNCNCGDDCPDECDCSCHEPPIKMVPVTDVDPTDDPLPNV